MPRFRKRPVEIVAVRWKEALRESAMLELLAEIGWEGPLTVTLDGRLRITTLEGVMLAKEGDWIIRGTRGELYPCDAEIFAETYDAVDRSDGLEEEMPAEKCKAVLRDSGRTLWRINDWLADTGFGYRLPRELREECAEAIRRAEVLGGKP